MLTPPFEDFERENAATLERAVSDGEFLYDLLADERSRLTFVQVTAYKLLGPVFVRFPYYADNPAQKADALQQSCLLADDGDELGQALARDDFGLGERLLRYDLTGIGYRSGCTPAESSCSPRPAATCTPTGTAARTSPCCPAKLCCTAGLFTATPDWSFPA